MLEAMQPKEGRPQTLPVTVTRVVADVAAPPERQISQEESSQLRNTVDGVCIQATRPAR